MVKFKKFFFFTVSESAASIGRMAIFIMENGKITWGMGKGWIIIIII
jgi:hypothetical protein